jgi:hypothetical protein
MLLVPNAGRIRKQTNFLLSLETFAKHFAKFSIDPIEKRFLQDFAASRLG